MSPQHSMLCTVLEMFSIRFTCETVFLRPSKPIVLPLNVYQPLPHQLFIVLCTTSLVVLVSLEVLGAASVKCKVFRDVTPCRFVNSYQRFGGSCCLCLQVLRVLKYTKLCHNTLVLTAY